MTLSALNEPLKAEYVKTRDQAGRTLSYIEGHLAIREANRVFGFDGWNRKTVTMEIIQAEQKPGTNNRVNWYVGYSASVEVRVLAFDNHSITRIGYGFGQGIDQDLGRAHESAIKEAETDAMKRALMTFGDIFGLALYDKEQKHVETKAQKSQASNSVADERAQFIKEMATKFKGWEGNKAQYDQAVIDLKAKNRDISDAIKECSDLEGFLRYVESVDVKK